MTQSTLQWEDINITCAKNQQPATLCGSRYWTDKGIHFARVKCANACGDCLSSDQEWEKVWVKWAGSKITFIWKEIA